MPLVRPDPGTGQEAEYGERREEHFRAAVEELLPLVEEVDDLPLQFEIGRLGRHGDPDRRGSRPDRLVRLCASAREQELTA